MPINSMCYFVDTNTVTDATTLLLLGHMVSWNVATNFHHFYCNLSLSIFFGESLSSKKKRISSGVVTGTSPPSVIIFQ